MAEKKRRRQPATAVFLCQEDCREKLDRYFGEFLPQSGEIADVESLADFLGVTRTELLLLRDGGRYARQVGLAFNRIAKIKKQLAFCGKLPASVLSFDLRNNHGYLEKPDAADEAAGSVIFRGGVEAWAK